MVSAVVAGGASPVGEALQAVVVNAGLAGHLGIGLVVTVGTDVVAQVLGDHVVRSSGGVAVFELEQQGSPFEGGGAVGGGGRNGSRGGQG